MRDLKCTLLNFLFDFVFQIIRGATGRLRATIGLTLSVLLGLCLLRGTGTPRLGGRKFLRSFGGLLRWSLAILRGVGLCPRLVALFLVDCAQLADHGVDTSVLQ